MATALHIISSMLSFERNTSGIRSPFRVFNKTYTSITGRLSCGMVFSSSTLSSRLDPLVMFNNDSSSIYVKTLFTILGI